ncbi:MAG TPA: DUF2076 domain-containing protein [Acetobacteraceae bacterium]|nr:DUF2076 domain-containing protein [Acetobacteraceae bacterium]
MTNEERDIIAGFVARVGGAGAPQPTQWAGASVPATTAPALPPVDREADAFIGEQFNRYPDARYRITQLAFVQEHALVEAQSRIKRLEWELQQARQAAEQVAAQAPQSGGGFFSGLFGGRAQSPPPGGPWGHNVPPPGYQQGPPPQYPPQYAPAYQPGLFQRGGSGFLGSALTTAAGVAGGVLAADAIRDLFSPHQGLAGGIGPGAGFAGNPWAGPDTPMPPADPGYVDQGSWGTPDSGAATPDQGYVDSGTWDQAAPDPSADPSGGGWDSGGGDPGIDAGGGAPDDDSLI